MPRNMVLQIRSGNMLSIYNSIFLLNCKLPAVKTLQGMNKTRGRGIRKNMRKNNSGRGRAFHCLLAISPGMEYIK